MMHITRLTAIILMCAVVALAINAASAQERLVFDVDAENSKYTEQHVIDVGDAPGSSSAYI